MGPRREYAPVATTTRAPVCPRIPTLMDGLAPERSRTARCRERGRVRGMTRSDAEAPTSKNTTSGLNCGPHLVHTAARTVVRGSSTRGGGDTHDLELRREEATRGTLASRTVSRGRTRLTGRLNRTGARYSRLELPTTKTSESNPFFCPVRPERTRVEIPGRAVARRAAALVGESDDERRGRDAIRTSAAAATGSTVRHWCAVNAPR